MSVAIFAQNHSSRTSAWNGICICCIQRKSNILVFIATQHVQPTKYSTFISRATRLVNRFRAAFVAKTSPENIIWIVTYSIQAAINHGKKVKPLVTFVANYLAELIICANICAHILVNQRANEIINVHIARNRFMVHRC